MSNSKVYEEMLAIATNIVTNPEAKQALEVASLMYNDSEYYAKYWDTMSDYEKEAEVTHFFSTDLTIL